MTIKAIIFDCFDVLYIDQHKSLVESFPGHRSELNDLRRQMDYGFFTPQEWFESAARITCATPEEIRLIILEANKTNQPLMDFITHELKPRYKIGMVSNIGRGWIENFFTQHQLHDFFDAVVLSGDEGVTKPHPQIFELIAERLGCDVSECLMIDDLPENIAGADAAGMHGVVYGSLRDMKIELKNLGVI